MLKDAASIHRNGMIFTQNGNNISIQEDLSGRRKKVRR